MEQFPIELLSQREGLTSELVHQLGHCCLERYHCLATLVYFLAEESKARLLLAAPSRYELHP